MSSLRICDKCGQPVPAANSCRRYDEFTQAFIPPLQRPGDKEDRHLFPVGNCEGSPSRMLQLYQATGKSKMVFDTSLPFEAWPFTRPSAPGTSNDEEDKGTM